MAHIKVILNTETGEVEIEGSSKVEEHLEKIIDSLDELDISEDASHVLIGNSIADYLDDYEKEVSIETEEYEDEEDEEDILIVTKYIADADSIIEALDSILEDMEEILESDEDEEDE